MDFRCLAIGVRYVLFDSFQSDKLLSPMFPAGAFSFKWKNSLLNLVVEVNRKL